MRFVIFSVSLETRHGVLSKLVALVGLSGVRKGTSGTEVWMMGAVDRRTIYDKIDQAAKQGRIMLNLKAMVISLRATRV